MKGYVHSFESFGTVDGPGIRFVVFFQGCPLRCKYCHNPDTWKPCTGGEFSVAEIIEKYERCVEFLRDGGITATGGEPLLQIDFLTELFKKCKDKSIHTCLDTSGVTFNVSNTQKIDLLMTYTDLVMLDIKHIDNEKHIELTGVSNKNILEFARYLHKIKKPVWIRHVLVPGITTNEDELLGLGCFLGGLRNIKALDVLPYHTMGNAKYKQLNMELPLEGVPEATTQQAIEARKIIIKGIRQKRMDDEK